MAIKRNRENELETPSAQNKKKKKQNLLRIRGFLEPFDVTSFGTDEQPEQVFW